MVTQTQNPQNLTLKRSIIFIKVVAFLAASTYALSQVIMTAGDKYIFTNFKAVTPMSLLFIQCVLTGAISSSLMLYKEVNRGAFHFLVKYGIVVPPLSDM